MITEAPTAFRAARVRNGLSQRTLGRRLGVTRQCVSNWERGYSYPSQENLDKLCLVLGLNYNEYEVRQ